MSDPVDPEASPRVTRQQARKQIEDLGSAMRKQFPSQGGRLETLYELLERCETVVDQLFKAG